MTVSVGFIRHGSVSPFPGGGLSHCFIWLGRLVGDRRRSERSALAAWGDAGGADTRQQGAGRTIRQYYQMSDWHGPSAVLPWYPHFNFQLALEIRVAGFGVMD